MNINLLEFSSAWRELKKLLSEHKSAVLIGPRHYGKWSVLEKYARASSGTDVKCVTLTSRIPTVQGDLEYSWLWSSVSSQLGQRKRRKVIDRFSFLEALEALLDETHAHVIAFIDGAGRGYEENHYRVVSAFQHVLRTGRLSVAVTDDYSSFYYQKQNFMLSDLHSLLNLQIAPASPAEIGAYIKAVVADGKEDEYIKHAAERVHSWSGGHIGVAEDILRGLHWLSWPSLGASWDQLIDEILRSSFVLESINRALEEDAEGYSHTALEYRSPACPEQNSPRIHVLRQLGVLQRTEPPLVRLCPGAITKLVEGLAQHANTPSRVGTIVSESGPRIFEKGSVELTDDDIIVLHLSDLHVGEHFRYRLSWTGAQLNPNEHSAGELLSEDLRSLELLGRVDAIVLSGDFVWNGTPTEFRRAEAVVREILEGAGLGLSQAILIPGNHDVEWNPGVLGSTRYGKPVSRESYDDFLRLLGKTSQGELEALEVTSRSKQVKLQILGLDSNRVEGPEAAGIGFVSRDALTLAKKAIEASRPDPQVGPKVFTWMAVHHHIFPATSAPLADAQGKVVSTMANAAEVLDCANQYKVEVILHGHEHQPSVTVARRWPVDVGEAFAPVAAIGAGSFGVKREYLGPFSRNQYYVLIRRAHGILIRSRAQGGGGVRFIPHSDMWLPR